MDNNDIPNDAFAVLDKAIDDTCRRLDEADALRKELRNAPTINWHEGPARGGGGSFGKDSKGRALWGDGDRLLIAVELSNGGLDIAKVVISTDGETFSVLMDDDTGDDYGDWSPDDWSWWAKDYDENPRLVPEIAKESEASHE